MYRRALFSIKTHLKFQSLSQIHPTHNSNFNPTTLYTHFNQSASIHASTFLTLSKHKKESHKTDESYFEDPDDPLKLFLVQPHLRPDAYLQAKLSEALNLANSLEEQRDGFFIGEFCDKDLPKYAVVQNQIQRRSTIGTFFGKGKVDAIKIRLNAMEEKGEIDAVFVNAVLSAIQPRNLERVWEKPVLDRVGLIIDSYNTHAQTREAKLQAELAALNYKKTSLVRTQSPGGHYTFGESGEAEVVSARGSGRGGRGFIGGDGETELQLQRRRKPLHSFLPTPYSVPPLYFPSRSPLHHHRSCSFNFICKAFRHEPTPPAFQLLGRLCIHSFGYLNCAHHSQTCAENKADGDVVGATAKIKRPKLKGKRAVVRWLKFFRFKKKKEYERMTPEEKILYKLRKARKKEERMVESLKKLEPKETSETFHDPEILSPEEHFYFLKMGLKCKNYVPVGRRGIYQGVILNMHLHWKKHQTLQVIVKTFTPEEVKDIAIELARLTGGIVLDIHEENTIIMYRGKNYVQPPTEIMSPRVTLSRKKALDKSKYRDGLRAVRKYIPRLQQDLELLQAHAKNHADTINDPIPELLSTENGSCNSADPSNSGSVYSARLRELIGEDKTSSDDEDSITDHDDELDSDALSDIFETESDSDAEQKVEKPLYLDAFDRIPVNKDNGSGDFEEHLRQISMTARSKKSQSGINGDNTPDFDEVDQMVLRAASLLKKKRK